MRSLGLLCVLVFAAGCSLSTSAEMGSDSSKSSESSSRSSTSDEKKKESYRKDVRSYTAAYIESGGPVEAFEKKLGELARGYGVSNWEDDPATYVSIGAGLAEAGVGRVDLVAYTTQLSRSDPTKTESIRWGYDARQ